MMNTNNTEVGAVKSAIEIQLSAEKAVTIISGYYGDFMETSIPFICDTIETADSLVEKIYLGIGKLYPAKCYSGGKMTTPQNIKVNRNSQNGGIVSFSQKWIES